MNQPEKINYNAFSDDTVENLPQQSTGLKENIANKSRFAKPANAPPKRTASDFDHDVAEHQRKDIDIRNKAAELSTKYRSLLKDKTLEQNKGPNKRDLENQVIAQLCDIGIRLNNDQVKPEGVGSIGLINLLLRAVLIQRDTINDLGYKVFKLQSALSELLKAVEEEEEEEKSRDDL